MIENKEENPVVVIGGGWAGLAAAVKLSQKKIPVTVFESAKQIGGRARSVRFNNLSIDNGQHLLLGAYEQVLTLMKVIGLNPEQLLYRLPLHLKISSLQNRKHIKLKSPQHIFAPLHLLIALISTTSLTTAEKYSIIRFWLYISRSSFNSRSDTSTLELLQLTRQSRSIIEHLWSPLCLAALNTPISKASAKVFVEVLLRSFAHRRHHSDLLIPRVSLGELVPQPAMEYIERNGGQVLLGEKAVALDIEGGQIKAVQTTQRVIPANHVVIALPPQNCARLFEPHPDLQSLAANLSQYNYEPICTVYLQYPAHVKLGHPMVGYTDGISQWVFDRGVCDQPGLMAVVISANGSHMQYNNEELINHVSRELASQYPDWPKPTASLVIREKRATFACIKEIGNIRPTGNTPVSGCWLAGDYIDTQLPATLEGAVISGFQAAENIISHY